MSSDGTLFVAGTGGLRAFSNYDSVIGPTARFGIAGNIYHLSVHGTKLLQLSDNRVEIYNQVPADAQAQVDVTGGGAEGCEADQLDGAGGAYLTPLGQLVVADTGNNRVLIWNEVPESDELGPANFVIGQPRMNTCLPNAVNADGSQGPGGAASDQSLNAPTSVWSDGVKLVVVDGGNHRVLVYDFPTRDFPKAMRVIGQANFNGVEPNAGQPGVSSSGLSSPASVDVRAGGQMAIADSGNHRVLIWDTFPQENAQAANQVIGQRDFAGSAENAGGDPGASTLSTPMGVRFDKRNLVVVDQGNHRVLVFPSNN